MATGGDRRGCLSVFVAYAAAQGKPSYTCSTGFTRVSLAGAVLLPRTQDAINAGLITPGEALAGYQPIDTNATGYICYKLPPGWPGSSSFLSQYYYEFVDDNASVPAG